MARIGVLSRRIFHKQIPDPCPSCEATHTLQLEVKQGFFFFAFFPFFPTGRTISANCTKCGNVFSQFAFTPAMSRRFLSLAHDIKTPWWTWLGTGFLAVVMVGGLISKSINDNRNLEYIQQPKIGDVYELKTDNGEFTLLKVTKVDKDSIEVVENEFSTDRQSGLVKLKREKGEDYIDIPFALPRKDLSRMLKDETILNVDR